MGKRANNRKRKNKQQLMDKLKSMNSKVSYSKNSIIKILGVIAVIGICLISFNKFYIYNDKIAKNIMIESTDVSNLTKEETLAILKDEYKPQNIKLNYEGKQYKILPEDIELAYNIEEAINQAYNYTKQGSYLENIKTYFATIKNGKKIRINSTYNEAKLSSSIENISKKINVKTRDAKVSVDGNGNISVTPSLVGKEMDIVSNKEAIYEIIKSKNYKDLDIKVVLKQPEVNTEQAKTVNTLLGEYSTRFSMGQTGRASNVIRSANSTSNVLLMPGQEFSYNALTGPRIKSNGYKDAPVIVKGKIEQESGGGVCQTSSTLYNAALYSGLEITSVQNHSLKSKYIPVGQDAMVSYGGSDFRFKNPYKHPVYVKNISGNGILISRIYGNGEDKQNISIKVDKFKYSGLDAAKTYRQYKDASGNVIKTEYINTSVYKKPKK